MLRYFRLVILFFVLPGMPSAFAQTGSGAIFDSLRLIAAGASLNRVSDQFMFTEGPAVDKAGNIYFTDQPNDRIWKYGTDGNLSLFMENTGRSNGLYIDQEGNIIACADAKDELWRITPEKKVTVLLGDYEGKRLNGPNDLWIDAQGGIYFTDPYYQRPYWTRKASYLDGQKIYYLPPGAHKAVMVSDSLVKPNGIVGSADGRWLYVADIGDGKTYRFSIRRPGVLGEIALFAAQGADGITLDQDGNLYLAGDGVTIYNPGGIKIGHIPVPEKWTANLCFGGADRKTLFLTASTAVYTIRMAVAGIE